MKPFIPSALRPSGVSRWWIAVLCGLVATLSACMDEEKFDTRAGDRLRFSVDTLSFDTVLAGVDTPTRYFMAYNPNSHGVSITDVSFAGGASGGFRVNVDGMYINHGMTQTIDCRGGDSLRVFVELTPTASTDEVCSDITVQLRFTLSNGETDAVVLTATQQNVEVLREQHITGDTLLEGRLPYLVYGHLTVDEGATLTLAPGCCFYFHTDAYLRVEGTLQAIGTGEQQIVMRGDRTDNMFEGQPYDRVPNQWQGIRFTGSSYGNHLVYCDIHSGNYGLVCDSSDTSREKLRLENSVVHNMSKNCLTLTSCQTFVGNSQISNAGAKCIYILGGVSDFIHVTVAQFYPFDGIAEEALYFANESSGLNYPLEKMSFRNSIITGYNDDDIMGWYSDESKGVAYNYSFSHCLLNTPKVDDDPGFVACAWESDSKETKRAANFPHFNLPELIFSFALAEKSLAVGIADPQLTSIYYPTDRLSRPRLTDGQSDAGCYEMQPAPKEAK